MSVALPSLKDLSAYVPKEMGVLFLPPYHALGYDRFDAETVRRLAAAYAGRGATVSGAPSASAAAKAARKSLRRKRGGETFGGVTFGAAFLRGEMAFQTLLVLVGSNYLFKATIALLDTGPLYLAVHYLRPFLQLKPGETVGPGDNYADYAAQ